jgi:hypothetical protein
VKPNALAVEDKTRDIGEGARPNASAFCQMNIIANLPLQPLFFVHINRNRSISTFCNTAAATRIAIGKMGAVLNDIEGSPIGSNNTLAV